MTSHDGAAALASGLEAPTADVALAVEDVRLAYGDLTVVWNVSMTVRAGRTTALVGRNGAGKTTLLAGIAGLLRCRTGRILLDGEDVTRLAPWNRAKRGLALVQEGKRILRTLTVEENLTLALQGNGVGRRERSQRLAEIYDRFQVLAQRRREQASQLSGGQQQMLAIAQALIAKPKVLLLDEPSSGLAPIIVHEILALIDGLKAEGIGIVLVEQLIDEVMSGVAQDVVLLERGRVVLADAAENLTVEKLAGQIL